MKDIALFIPYIYHTASNIHGMYAYSVIVINLQRETLSSVTEPTSTVLLTLTLTYIKMA